MSDISIQGTLGANGSFPIVHDTDLEGGFRVVSDLTARDAIPSARLKIGMLAYVVSQDNLYQLRSTSPVVWVRAPVGSSGRVAPGTQSVTIYCRSTGDDTTGDGSLANPYKTPHRAVLDIPTITGGVQYIVDLSDYGDTLVLTEPVDLSSIHGCARGPSNDLFPDSWGSIYTDSDVWFYAGPSATPLLTLTSAQYVASVDSVTSLLTITVSGASWVTNQFKGKILRIDGTTQLGVVTSNTATAMTTTFVGNPSGATLTISDRSCVIDANETDGFFLATNENSEDSIGSYLSVIITGVKFSVSDDNLFGPVDQSSYTRMTLVCCEALELFRVKSDLLTSAYNHYAGQAVSTIHVNSKQLNMVGEFVENASIISSTQNDLNMQSCEAVGCKSIGGSLGAQQERNTIVVENCYIHDTTQPGVFPFGHSFGFIGNCRISNCTGGGIVLAHGATAELTGKLSGSGNGNVGVSVLDYSTMLVQAGALTSDLTGTGGDIKVGQRVARTWSSFSASAPIGLEVDDQQGGRMATLSNANKRATNASIYTVTSVKTANYTANPGELVLVDPTAGGFNVTLPFASSNPAAQVAIKNVTTSTNAVTVKGTSTNTVEGATSATMNTARAFRAYVNDGVSNNMLVGSVN